MLISPLDIRFHYLRKGQSYYRYNNIVLNFSQGCKRQNIRFYTFPLCGNTVPTLGQ